MPNDKVIEDPAFKKEGELTPEILEKLRVASYAEAAKKLLPNWRGNPVLLLGATPGQDGKTLQNCDPILVGSLFRKTPREYVTKKFWNFTENIMLKLQPIDLSTFEFKGTLKSELVDSSAIAHSFIMKDDKSEVPAQTLADQGYTGFCVRVYMYPTTGYQSKLKLVLYPAKKEEVEKDHPLAPNPKFPGLLVTATDLDIGINYSQVMDKSIGSTVVPCMVSQAQFDQGVQIPTAEEVVACVSALMRTGVNPETLPSHKELWDRWAELKADGANKLKTMAVKARWPLAEVTAAPGNPNFLNLYYSYHINSNRIIILMHFIKHES